MSFDGIDNVVTNSKEGTKSLWSIWKKLHFKGDLKHQYILAGLNKYYHNSYAGFLLGVGELKYRYNPLNNSKTNDYTTTSPMIGL
ncbi:MAG: hypothetical protein IE909_08970 [Campylobacterales bacterium]|nr:hypothetical protein [Campylobacterales bacterium]